MTNKKFMKYTLIFIAFFLMSCANNDADGKIQLNAKDTSNIIGDYPAQIQQLGLEYYYDKTRWMMYCIYCDEKLNVPYKPGVNDSLVTLGMLPIKFTSLNVKNDSIEIRVWFYFDNAPLNNKLYNKPIYSGMGYDIAKDSILYYVELNYYVKMKCDRPGSCPERSIVPLQPQVVDYIKRNRKKLDPWFRREAIKRGVIKG